MPKHYLSPEGLKKIQDEMVYLKVHRKELASRMEEARAMGDLSENAEYHEAKDALGLCEGRMMQINEIMKDYEVVEADKGVKEHVSIGNTVDVMVNGKQKTFAIVGSNESDPLTGHISNESPIGSALLGMRVGDTVDVKSPAGVTQYQVVAIH